MDHLIISGVGGSLIVVGRVVAIVAGMVVCLICVGVVIGACIEPWIWRRITHCLSSLLSLLHSMTLALGSQVVQVGRDVMIRIVFSLAVRGVLMTGRLTCSEIGNSSSGACMNAADNCKEWMHSWSCLRQWSSAGSYGQAEAEGKEQGGRMHRF